MKIGYPLCELTYWPAFESQLPNAVEQCLLAIFIFVWKQAKISEIAEKSISISFWVCQLVKIHNTHRSKLHFKTLFN